MSKSNVQMSALSTQSLEQALKSVKAISADRSKWEKTEFATASDMLYSLLGKVYDLYMTHKDDADVSPALKKQLKDDGTNAGINFRSNNPHLIDLLVENVFAGDPAPRNAMRLYIRLSKMADEEGISTNAMRLYILLLKNADEEGISTSAGLIKFIKELGGLEELHRARELFLTGPRSKRLA